MGNQPHHWVVGTAIANPTVAARTGQYYIAGQQVPAYQQQQPAAQNSTQIRTPNPLNPTRINIHNPTPTRHPQNLSTQIHQQNPALFQQNQQPQNPTTIPSPIRILQNPKRTTAGFQSSQNSAFSNYNYSQQNPAHQQSQLNSGSNYQNSSANSTLSNGIQLNFVNSNGLHVADTLNNSFQELSVSTNGNHYLIQNQNLQTDQPLILQPAPGGTTHQRISKQTVSKTPKQQGASQQTVSKLQTSQVQGGQDFFETTHLTKNQNSATLASTVVSSERVSDSPGGASQTSTLSDSIMSPAAIHMGVTN